MKRIRNIELVLENCEFVIIDTEYINEIKIMDIQKNIIGYSGASHPSVYEYCDNVHMVIYGRINDTEQEGLFSDDYSIAQRLKEGRDITQIEVLYDDYPPEILWVNFKGDYFNQYQSGCVDEEGNIWIDIKRPV